MKFLRKDILEVSKWVVLVILEGIIQNYVLPTISNEGKIGMMAILKYSLYCISICIGLWILYSMVLFIVKKVTQKQREDIELLKGSFAAYLEIARTSNIKNDFQGGRTYNDADRFYGFLQKEMNKRWENEKFRPDIANRVNVFLNEIAV